MSYNLRSRGSRQSPAGLVATLEALAQPEIPVRSRPRRTRSGKAGPPTRDELDIRTMDRRPTPRQAMDSPGSRAKPSERSNGAPPEKLRKPPPEAYSQRGASGRAGIGANKHRADSTDSSHSESKLVDSCACANGQIFTVPHSALTPEEDVMAVTPARACAQFCLDPGKPPLKANPPGAAYSEKLAKKEDSSTAAATVSPSGGDRLCVRGGGRLRPQLFLPSPTSTPSLNHCRKKRKIVLKHELSGLDGKVAKAGAANPSLSFVCSSSIPTNSTSPPSLGTLSYPSVCRNTCVTSTPPASSQQDYSAPTAGVACPFLQDGQQTSKDHEVSGEGPRSPSLPAPYSRNPLASKSQGNQNPSGVEPQPGEPVQSHDRGRPSTANSLTVSGSYQRGQAKPLLLAAAESPLCHPTGPEPVSSRRVFSAVPTVGLCQREELGGDRRQHVVTIPPAERPAVHQVNATESMRPASSGVLSSLPPFLSPAERGHPVECQPAAVRPSVPSAVAVTVNNINLSQPPGALIPNSASSGAAEGGEGLRLQAPSGSLAPCSGAILAPTGLRDNAAGSPLCSMVWKATERLKLTSQLSEQERQEGDLPTRFLPHLCPTASRDPLVLSAASLVSESVSPSALSAACPLFTRLPPAILCAVLQFLPSASIVAFGATCRYARALTQLPAAWNLLEDTAVQKLLQHQKAAPASGRNSSINMRTRLRDFKALAVRFSCVTKLAIDLTASVSPTNTCYFQWQTPSQSTARATLLPPAFLRLQPARIGFFETVNSAAGGGGSRPARPAPVSMADEENPSSVPDAGASTGASLQEEAEALLLLQGLLSSAGATIGEGSSPVSGRPSAQARPDSVAQSPLRQGHARLPTMDALPRHMTVASSPATVPAPSEASLSEPDSLGLATSRDCIAPSGGCTTSRAQMELARTGNSRLSRSHASTDAGGGASPPAAFQGSASVDGAGTPRQVTDQEPSHGAMETGAATGAPGARRRLVARRLGSVLCASGLSPIAGASGEDEVARASPPGLAAPAAQGDLAARNHGGLVETRQGTRLPDEEHQEQDLRPDVESGEGRRRELVRTPAGRRRVREAVSMESLETCHSGTRRGRRDSGRGSREGSTGCLQNDTRHAQTPEGYQVSSASSQASPLPLLLLLPPLPLQGGMTETEEYEHGDREIQAHIVHGAQPEAQQGIPQREPLHGVQGGSLQEPPPPEHVHQRAHQRRARRERQQLMLLHQLLVQLRGQQPQQPRRERTPGSSERRGVSQQPDTQPEATQLAAGERTRQAGTSLINRRLHAHSAEPLGTSRRPCGHGGPKGTESQAADPGGECCGAGHERMPSGSSRPPRHRMCAASPPAIGQSLVPRGSRAQAERLPSQETDSDVARRESSQLQQEWSQRSPPGRQRNLSGAQGSGNPAGAVVFAGSLHGLPVRESAHPDSSRRPSQQAGGSVAHGAEPQGLLQEDRILGDSAEDTSTLQADGWLRTRPEHAQIGEQPIFLLPLLFASATQPHLAMSRQGEQLTVLVRRPGVARPVYSHSEGGQRTSAGGGPAGEGLSRLLFSASRLLSRGQRVRSAGGGGQVSPAALRVLFGGLRQLVHLTLKLEARDAKQLHQLSLQVDLVRGLLQQNAQTLRVVKISVDLPQESELLEQEATLQSRRRQQRHQASSPGALQPLALPQQLPALQVFHTNFPFYLPSGFSASPSFTHLCVRCLHRFVSPHFARAETRSAHVSVCSPRRSASMRLYPSPSAWPDPPASSEVSPARRGLGRESSSHDGCERESVSRIGLWAQARPESLREADGGAVREPSCPPARKRLRAEPSADLGGFSRDTMGGEGASGKRREENEGEESPGAGLDWGLSPSHTLSPQSDAGTLSLQNSPASSTSAVIAAHLNSLFPSEDKPPDLALPEGRTRTERRVSATSGALSAWRSSASLPEAALERGGAPGLSSCCFEGIQKTGDRFESSWVSSERETDINSIREGGTSDTEAAEEVHSNWQEKAGFGVRCVRLPACSKDTLLPQPTLKKCRISAFSSAHGNSSQPLYQLQRLLHVGRETLQQVDLQGDPPRTFCCLHPQLKFTNLRRLSLGWTCTAELLLLYSLLLHGHLPQLRKLQFSGPSGGSGLSMMHLQLYALLNSPPPTCPHHPPLPRPLSSLSCAAVSRREASRATRAAAEPGGEDERGESESSPEVRSGHAAGSCPVALSGCRDRSSAATEFQWNAIRFCAEGPKTPGNSDPARGDLDEASSPREAGGCMSCVSAAGLTPGTDGAASAAERSPETPEFCLKCASMRDGTAHGVYFKYAALDIDFDALLKFRLALRRHGLFAFYRDERNKLNLLHVEGITDVGNKDASEEEKSAENRLERKNEWRRRFAYQHIRSPPFSYRGSAVVSLTRTAASSAGSPPPSSVALWSSAPFPLRHRSHSRPHTLPASSSVDRGGESSGLSSRRPCGGGTPARQPGLRAGGVAAGEGQGADEQCFDCWHPAQFFAVNQPDVQGVEAGGARAQGANRVAQRAADDDPRRERLATGSRELSSVSLQPIAPTQIQFSPRQEQSVSPPLEDSSGSSERAPASQQALFSEFPPSAAGDREATASPPGAERRLTGPENLRLDDAASAAAPHAVSQADPLFANLSCASLPGSCAGALSCLRRLSDVSVAFGEQTSSLPACPASVQPYAYPPLGASQALGEPVAVGGTGAGYGPLAGLRSCPAEACLGLTGPRAGEGLAAAFRRVGRRRETRGAELQCRGPCAEDRSFPLASGESIGPLASPGAVTAPFRGGNPGAAGSTLSCVNNLSAFSPACPVQQSQTYGDLGARREALQGNNATVSCESKKHAEQRRAYPTVGPLMTGRDLFMLEMWLAPELCRDLQSPTTLGQLRSQLLNLWEEKLTSDQRRIYCDVIVRRYIEERHGVEEWKFENAPPWWMSQS